MYKTVNGQAIRVCTEFALVKLRTLPNFTDSTNVANIFNYPAFFPTNN